MKKIIISKKEYGLLLSINAIENLQNEFNVDVENLNEVFEDKKNVFKTLKKLICIFANAWIEKQNFENPTQQIPKLTEAEVGASINMKNTSEILKIITDVLSDDTEEDFTMAEAPPNQN